MTKEEVKDLLDAATVDSVIKAELVFNIIDMIFENNLSCPVMVDVKTESSDEYSYVFENVSSVEEVIDLLKDALGDEFAWIAEIRIDDSLSPVKIDSEQIFEEVYRLFDEMQ